MSPINISIIMIAQNAEQTIKRCLDSLVRFKEVIIIDGGSKDKTTEIAQSYPNVTLYENPWPGFIAQRNISLDKATLDWCFMMDADEALTPELVSYLAALDLNRLDKKIYRVLRTEYFEGVAVEHGFGSASWQERLLKRVHVRYCGGNHHNHSIDGKLCTWDHPELGSFPSELRILHNPDYTLDEIIQKLPRFSILIANEKLERGRSTNAFVVILSFIGTFFQVWLKSLRMGRIGFILAVNEAVHRCLVKLYIYNSVYLRKSRSAKSNYQSKNLG